MGEVRDPRFDQQLPVPNDRESIHRMVQADLELRRQVGIAKYGTHLQAFNGRNSLQDAYDEVLDLAVYLKQALVEQEEREEEVEEELICAHCGRHLPRFEGMVNDQPLCHPDDPNLLDCYRLVTVYDEPMGSRLRRS